MIVDGRHGKNTAAEDGGSKYLNNDAGKYYVDYARVDSSKKHLVDHNSIDCKQGSEAKRADVAHLKSRWFAIEKAVGE